MIEENHTDMNNINTAIADGLGKEINHVCNLDTGVYGPAVGAILAHAMVVVSDTNVDIDDKLYGQLFYIQIENATATLAPINITVERIIRKQYKSECILLETTNPKFPDNLLKIIEDLLANARKAR